MQGKSLRAHQCGCPEQLLLKRHCSRRKPALACDWKWGGFIKCVFTSPALIYQLLFKNYSQCHFLSFPNADVPLGTVDDYIKMMTLNLKPKI